MVLRVMVDSMLLLIFERRTLVWVRDESILAYTGGDLDWQKIDVGVFGAWLLNWVADEKKVCTWWRFALALRRIKLDSEYKKPHYGSL